MSTVHTHTGLFTQKQVHFYVRILGLDEAGAVPPGCSEKDPGLGVGALSCSPAPTITSCLALVNEGDEL